MCIAPNYIWIERGPKWEKEPVTCRACWQCRVSRVNDIVGRCLAEAAYSPWAVALTMTYREPKDGDLSHKVLNPPHFQSAMRAVRRRGHKTRYLGVGEYGDLSGRAHFHALLFGKPGSSKPEMPQQVNFWPDWWKHGHVYADWLGGSDMEKSIRYVCKYLLKGSSDPLQKFRNDQAWFTLSKRPPLGAAFFAEKAAQAVQLGVLPSSFTYVPPLGNRKRRYVMTGASRRNYLEAVIDGHLEGETWRRDQLNEWVTKSLEKLERFQHARSASYGPEAEFLEAFADQLEHSRPSKWKVLRNELDTNPESWTWWDQHDLHLNRG